VDIDGKRVLNNGQVSQCTKCKTVIISQYNPFSVGTNKLGNYANQVAYEVVGPITYMETDRMYHNSNLADMESYVWR